MNADNPWSRFGLTRDPFIGGQGEFTDDTLKQRQDLLHYLVQSSDLLVVVRGAEGSGRSTLLAQFLRRTAGQFTPCVIAGRGDLDVSEILVAMARAFGEEITSRDQRIVTENLSDRLIALSRTDAPPLLLVDDAHRLDPKVLELILNFYGQVGDGGRVLRVVLFAEPEVEGMLEGAARQLKYRRDAQSMDLPPFTIQQTEAYLQWCLRAAGADGRGPLSEAQVRTIHKASGGLPGRINEQARDTLLGGGGKKGGRGMKLAGVNLSWKVMAAGGAVLALALTLLLFQDAINALVAPPPATEDMHVAAAEPDATPPEHAPAPVAKGDPKAPPSGVLPNRIVRGGEPEVVSDEAPAAHREGTGEEVAPSSPPSQAKESPEAKPSAGVAQSHEAPEPPPLEMVATSGAHLEQGGDAAAPMAAPGTAGEVVAAMSGEAPHGDMIDRPQLPVMPQEPDVVLPPSPARADVEPAPTDIAVEAPPAVPVTEMPVEEVKGEGLGAGGSEAQSEAPVPVAEGEVRDEPLPEPAPEPEYRAEAWLLERNARHYTLQIFGADSEDAVRAYIDAHDLRQSTAYFKGLAKGKVWYSLVYGDYATLVEAKAAIKGFPVKNPDYTPWARSILSIHQAIKGAR